MQDVVRRQGLSDPLATPGAFDTAFERGFWNLAPDESGMYTREREGERLLERSRRELWKPGSASRKEIEAQIRIFLCRHPAVVISSVEGCDSVVFGDFCYNKKR